MQRYVAARLLLRAPPPFAPPSPPATEPTDVTPGGAQPALLMIGDSLAIGTAQPLAAAGRAPRELPLRTPTCGRSPAILWCPDDCSSSFYLARGQMYADAVRACA